MQYPAVENSPITFSAVRPFPRFIFIYSQLLQVVESCRYSFPPFPMVCQIRLLIHSLHRFINEEFGVTRTNKKEFLEKMDALKFSAHLTKNLTGQFTHAEIPNRLLLKKNMRGTNQRTDAHMSVRSASLIQIYTLLPLQPALLRLARSTASPLPFSVFVRCMIR